MQRFAVLALVGALIAFSSPLMASDECDFTKAMINSVQLHKQVRELFTAHQDFTAQLDQIKALQTTVIDICVKELKVANEHHAGNFVKLCTKAANLATSAKCDDSFVANGWDLLAFWDGIRLFKTQLQNLVLNEQDPTAKALYEKYLESMKDIFGKAKARHHQFFSNGGCDGSCESK